MKTTEQNWYVLDDPRMKNAEDTPSFKSRYIATTPHWHGINGLNCKARIVCELHEVDDKAEVARLIASAPEMDGKLVSLADGIRSALAKLNSFLVDVDANEPRIAAAAQTLRNVLYS